MSKIRLTESQLHRVIKESVKKILTENDNYPYYVEDYIDKKKLKEIENYLINLIRKNPRTDEDNIYQTVKNFVDDLFEDVYNRMEEDLSNIGSRDFDFISNSIIKYKEQIINNIINKAKL